MATEKDLEDMMTPAFADPMQGWRESQEKMSRAIARGNAEKAGFAWTMFEALRVQIQAFEAKLKDGEEVGVMLANFGQSVVLRVRSITFQHPHLIVMVGETDGGRRRELLQHVSQVSLLLEAIPMDGTSKRKPIGFHRQESER